MPLNQRLLRVQELKKGCKTCTLFCTLDTYGFSSLLEFSRVQELFRVLHPLFVHFLNQSPLKRRSPLENSPRSPRGRETNCFVSRHRRFLDYICQLLMLPRFARPLPLTDGFNSRRLLDLIFSSSRTVKQGNVLQLSRSQV